MRPSDAAAALAALRRRSSDLRSVAEIRLVSLEDGPGRGARLLLCRNAAGLECEVAVDRGFDVSALRWRGTTLGWHSPVGGGAAAISLADEDGLGLLRSFDGFLVTCGLEHYGAPETGPADAFRYALRTRTHRPLHGRVSSLRATLSGYGLESCADRPSLWCEGVVRQAALYGEVLELRRRIEIPVFESRILLRDRVVNAGWQPTRHAMLYHFNLGYPLLDEQTTLIGDVSERLRADFVARPPVPRDDAGESFEVESSNPDRDGWARVGLANPGLLGGTSLEIRYSARTLPGFGLWRAYQSGIFAAGLEPLSGVGPDQGYRSCGSPDYLDAGAARQYALDVSVGALMGVTT